MRKQRPAMTSRSVLIPYEPERFHSMAAGSAPSDAKSVHFHLQKWSRAERFSGELSVWKLLVAGIE